MRRAVCCGHIAAHAPLGTACRPGWRPGGRSRRQKLRSMASDAGAPPPAQPAGRVLSIQSHVVHGWVGNKCAVFPLQRLGFEVDPVMSVQFSNHTGYPTIKGAVFDGPALTELLAGLEANGLLGHTHLLTGYIGSASLLQAVAGVARKLREANPGLVYVCDPVMGDEGKMYVTPELVDAFRQTIVPLADLLVPNQFEAELLTGRQISSQDEALAAMGQLHDAGPASVVMTSFRPGPGGSSDGGGGGSAGQPIVLLASTRRPQLPGRPQRFRMVIPQLDAYFTGTGDLLAALLLAWTQRHPGDLATAAEKAVAGLQSVLAATAAACPPDLLASRERSAEVFRARELRVVAAQGALVDPAPTILAEPLP